MPDSGGTGKTCSSLSCFVQTDCAYSMCKGCDMCKPQGESRPMPTQEARPVKDEMPQVASTKSSRDKLVNQRTAQSLAYISTVLRRFDQRKTKTALQRWFGREAFTDEHRRAEVRRVLNSVAYILSFAEYVYDDACKPSVYAYVYPHGPKAQDHRNRKIVRLCDLFWNSRAPVQVETIVHEASHHEVAFTNDVCADEVIGGREAAIVEEPRSKLDSWVKTGSFVRLGGFSGIVLYFAGPNAVIELNPPQACGYKAYGRETCKSLAQIAPRKALSNADNYCYYVQDVIDLSEDV